MWLHRIKGSFYTLFFILLNLVYLVIELSFNARVLDVSASLSPSTDFGQLEIYGRTISASGATILAWRLLVPFHASLNLYRLVIKFFVIAVIVFPLVFMGQKKLVDDLVDFSSSETRRSAEILTLLKYGIANGFVEIDELAMDELTLQTAEGKMFINLSGLLAYNSSNMRNILEAKLDKIAGYAIATQQSTDTEQLYKNYLYARDQIVQQFNQYQQLVNELERQKSSSQTEAIALYEQSMNTALLPWIDYQQALEDSQGLYSIPFKQLVSIQNLLEKTQQQLNLCPSSRCFNEAVERLEFRLSQLLGFYTPVSDWCQQHSDIQRGRVLLCINDAAKIEKKIIQARKMTLAVHAGLSHPYEDKLDYLKSMDMRSSVFTNLKQEGIVADPDWSFSQYEKLLVDIMKQLNQRYLQQYSQAVITQFGADFKPRTEISEFNQIDMMQSYYQKALNGQAGDPVMINLTRQEFEDRYVAPLYFAKFSALLNKLRAGEEWYQSDAPYEQSGKSSLRNLLVPPVAIAFSLIFGLLNMLNLFLNFVFLLVKEKLWLRWLGIIMLSIMILKMPVEQDYQIYSQAAYQDLISETENNYGHWADVMDWVAKTEPLVYPLGNILRYNLLDGFNFD